MEKERQIENGCKIFSILFKNNDSSYEFGNFAGKAEIILKKIAELGETKDYYTSENLQELTNVFREINEVIKNNFGLKLNKNNY